MTVPPPLDAATLKALGLSEAATSEEINQRIINQNNGSYEFEFGAIKLVAPIAKIHATIAEIKKLPAQRRALRRQVERTHAKLMPKVQAQTASQEEAMNFCDDTVILFALDVIEGKADAGKLMMKGNTP